jgi:hypothetical protein
MDPQLWNPWPYVHIDFELADSKLAICQLQPVQDPLKSNGARGVEIWIDKNIKITVNTTAGMPPAAMAFTNTRNEPIEPYLYWTCWSVSGETKTALSFELEMLECSKGEMGGWFELIVEKGPDTLLEHKLLVNSEIRTCPIRIVRSDKGIAFSHMQLPTVVNVSGSRESM